MLFRTRFPTRHFLALAKTLHRAPKEEPDKANRDEYREDHQVRAPVEFGLGHSSANVPHQWRAANTPANHEAAIPRVHYMRLLGCKRWVSSATPQLGKPFLNVHAQERVELPGRVSDRSSVPFRDPVQCTSVMNGIVPDLETPLQVVTCTL